MIILSLINIYINQVLYYVKKWDMEFSKQQ